MENNQENIPPVIQPEPLKQDLFSKYKFLMFGILLLIVVGGGISWWNVTRKTTSSPPELLDLIVPADWKIYRDELEGIEFKYPKEWFLGVTPSKGEALFEVRNFSQYTEGGVIPSNGAVFSFKKGCESALNTNGYVTHDFGASYKELEKSFCKDGFQVFLTVGMESSMQDKNILEMIPSSLVKITDTSTFKKYANAEYGFEFQYPNNWQIPAKVLAGKPDYEKNNIISVQDPNRAPSDVGGSLDPVFIVRLYNNVSEIPPIANYLQAQPDEIKTTTKSVIVDSQNVQETDYESFAVEGAYDITNQVRLNKNNKVYILQLSYTLAGCSQIPEDIRPQCEAENSKLKNKSNQAWDQFLSSFKFTKLESPNVTVGSLKPDSFEWCMANGGNNRTPNYNAPKVCVLNNKVYEENCVSNDKYFVVESYLTDSVGANHLVKFKTNQSQTFDCKYVVENGDFVIKNEWAEYILALENNFLILDSGTGPDPRGLIVYDLNLRKKIYEDSYSQPINIKNNIVDYWTGTTKPVTEQSCPEFKKWEEGGLGSAIDARVSINLLTLVKKELGEYRCSPRQ